MSKSSTIKVQDNNINILTEGDIDFISLTDMLKAKDGAFFISDWLRNRNTLEYLSIWESINNPTFNYGEFAIIKSQAGLNSYKISVKEWVAKTGAIGIRAKTGRYGGTYAHKDIAFEFGTWISPVFKLYLIKEFQRLKVEESKEKNFEWDYRRFLSKVNYRIHTDSIKEIRIPNLSKSQENFVYADEAELLNVALFGITSKEWRKENPEESMHGRNIRDFADLHQLTVLANLESINATFIRLRMTPQERLIKLNQEAIAQLKSLHRSKYTITQFDSPFKKNKNNLE